MQRSCNSGSVYYNSSSNGDVTIQILLDDPLGLSLFKKFNYENYQESEMNDD